jgi:hypothetical protein
MKQRHRGRLRALAEREVLRPGRALNRSGAGSAARKTFPRAASYDVGHHVTVAGVRSSAVLPAVPAPVYAWGLPAEEPSGLAWPPKSSNSDASLDPIGSSYAPRPIPCSFSVAPRNNVGVESQIEPDDADIEAALGEMFGRPVEPATSALTSDLDRKWDEARTPSHRDSQAVAKGEAAGRPENSHEVFERMGRSMAFANNFNLGPVALDRHFDALEQGVDVEWLVPATSARALSSDIDDLDLVAELSSLAELDAARQARFRHAPSPPAGSVAPAPSPVQAAPAPQSVAPAPTPPPQPMQEAVPTAAPPLATIATTEPLSAAAVPTIDNMPAEARVASNTTESDHGQANL